LDTAVPPVTPSVANAQGKDVRRFRIQRLLVYLLAIASLIWVFHDVHLRQLLAALSITKWRLVMLAITVDILTYVLQGIRWSMLLAPVGRLSILRTTQAIYAGLFTNEVIPLRFGELVRAFVVSRWLSSRLAAVVPSMLIERFLDAFLLAATVAVTAAFVPLPKDLIQAGYVLGGIVLFSASLFVWIVLRKGKDWGCGDYIFASRVRRRLSESTSQLADGFRNIGVSYRFCLAALLSASMLICQVLALWFMMLACGIDLSFAAGTITLVVVRLGTALPNAPANIGSFQFFCVLALGLFGVEKTTAAGFSIMYFLTLTVPLWILGLLAISRCGISLSTIRIDLAAFQSRSRSCSMTL
jgi:glycosyltransferase 2 family protein